MKRILKSIGKRVAAGACYSIIPMALILVLFWNSISDGSWSGQIHTIESPHQVRVISYEQRNDCDDFTVRGTLENRSDTLWESAELTITVYAGTAQIKQFTDRVGYVEPKSEKKFSVSCIGIDGRGLPDNISCRVEVSEIYTKRKNL